MLSLKKPATYWLIVLLFFVISAHSQQTDNIYTIPKNTKIRVRMDNEINSKVSSVNDTFTVQTVDPIHNRGVEILPAGLLIEGRILQVKKASIGKKPGSFQVKFETLFLPENGGKRRIEGDLIAKEELEASQTANVLAVAGTTAAGGVLGAVIKKSKGALIGAGVGLGIGTSFLLLKKGEEARIRANEEFEILFQTDVKLPSPEV